MVAARLAVVSFVAACFLAGPPSACGADPWVAPYKNALDAAREGDWTAARASFQQAIQHRPEDDTAETWFRTSPTIRTVWRNGAPYSPNFAAAYCAFRAGKESEESGAARGHFETAAKELEALVEKGEFNLSVYYVLAQSYEELGRVGDRNQLIADAQAKEALGKIRFRIDTAMMLDVDLVAARKLLEAEPEAPGDNQPDVTAPEVPEGIIPYQPDKYAILIGNTRYHGSIEPVPNAVNDCHLLKEALTHHAGYDPAHVTVLEEPTAEEMRAGVQQLAASLPPGATVFLFYAGAGRVNPKDSRDYLIPNGAANRDAFEQFVKKTDLLAFLGERSGHTIAVFEVSRNEENEGQYFGNETPKAGSFAHMNACWTEERCLARTTSRGTYGLWAVAAAWVLENKMRGPAVNAESFCFEVLNRMLDINTGGAGESVQTPMLPGYLNLGQADANF
jgi:tetratricopeptide (TPR) repeat protein